MYEMYVFLHLHQDIITSCNKIISVKSLVQLIKTKNNEHFWVHSGALYFLRLKFVQKVFFNQI